MLQEELWPAHLAVAVDVSYPERWAVRNKNVSIWGDTRAHFFPLLHIGNGNFKSLFSDVTAGVCPRGSIEFDPLNGDRGIFQVDAVGEHWLDMLHIWMLNFLPVFAVSTDHWGVEWEVPIPSNDNFVGVRQCSEPGIKFLDLVYLSIVCKVSSMNEDISIRDVEWNLSLFNTGVCITNADNPYLKWRWKCWICLIFLTRLPYLSLLAWYFWFPVYLFDAILWPIFIVVCPTCCQLLVNFHDTHRTTFKLGCCNETAWQCFLSYLCSVKNYLRRFGGP